IHCAAQGIKEGGWAELRRGTSRENARHDANRVGIGRYILDQFEPGEQDGSGRTSPRKGPSLCSSRSRSVVSGAFCSKSRRLLQIVVAFSIGWLAGKRRRRKKPWPGSKIEELHHVIGIRVACCQLPGIEGVFNETQDRSVITRRMRYEIRSCP